VEPGGELEVAVPDGAGGFEESFNLSGIHVGERRGRSWRLSRKQRSTGSKGGKKKDFTTKTRRTQRKELTGETQRPTAGLPRN
jgi:hypothetical protein